MKKLLVYLFLILCHWMMSQNKELISKDSISSDSILIFSKSFLGTNYCYGSCNPKKGFDCSGFVHHVFHHFDVKAPRSSRDYTNIGKTIHPDSFQVGDIIVFTGTNAKNRTPGHVGIITTNANKELEFIHSSSNKKHSGIKLSNYIESPYYEKRFLKIVRIVKVY